MNAVGQAQLLENIDIQQLIGKRIGYYTGSFDPIHYGHQRIIDQLRQKNLVDYIIIYPVGSDDRYKNRTDVSIRKEMIGALYNSEPHVLMTNLSPTKMQELFAGYIGKLELIGVIGSDVVIDNLTHSDETYRQKVSKVFMRGLPIPAKHSDDGIGAVMALPVTSFIVALRDEKDLSHLKEIFDRPIKAFLDRSETHFSSTKVREALKSSGSIEGMVAPRVQEVIKKYGLYH